MKISKDTKKILRYILSFPQSWIIITSVFLGLSLAFYLVILSFKIPFLLALYYLSGVIISIILLGGLGMVTSNLILKYFSLKNVRKYQEEKNPEIVIILGYDTWAGFIISSYLGIKYLIEYIKLRDKKFRIYITPSRKDFNKILNNKKIRSLYLVGHGSSRSFALNKKENLHYSDYRESQIIKDEIHLYHCGHGDGKTLIDYLVKKENRKKCRRNYDKEKLIFYIVDFYDLYKKELRRVRE